MIRPISLVSTVAAPSPDARSLTACVDMRWIRSSRVSPVNLSMPSALRSTTIAPVRAASTASGRELTGVAIIMYLDLVNAERVRVVVGQRPALRELLQRLNMLGLVHEAVLGNQPPQRHPFQRRVALRVFQPALGEILDPALQLAAHALQVVEDAVQVAPL